MQQCTLSCAVQSGEKVGTTGISERDAGNTKGCERCARLPEIPSGAGRLLLHVPVRHMRARVTAALDASGEPWTTDGDDRNGGRVYATVTSDVTAFARTLLPRLSGEERVEVRAMFEPAGRQATVADFFSARSVGTFLERTQQRWLSSMLADERLQMHFQPIVDAPAPNTIYGFECLMRGVRAADMPEQSGPGGNVPALVYPDELLSAAHDADLLFQLDLAARLAAIRAAAEHAISEAVFINFSPAAIYDPAFCLRSTIAAVSKVGLRPEQIVFEVTETERVPSSTAHLLNILDHYRRAGFRVALDDVGSGYSSLVMLGDVRPDFVKLDKGLTMAVLDDPFRAVIAEKLIEVALRTGMKIVAEGIENAESANWFASRGVHYLQGYHFARPAALPPRTFAH